MRTTTKKTRRGFTAEFKREAAVLLRDSGRPLTQAASELGLEPSVLRRWRSLAHGTGQAVPAVRLGAVAAVASAEQVGIRRLRKELERARMERGILRKAAGIFSIPPRRGSVSSRTAARCFPRGRRVRCCGAAPAAVMPGVAGQKAPAPGQARRWSRTSGACTSAAGVAAAVRARMRPCGRAETWRGCRRGRRAGRNRVARPMRDHGIQAHRRRPFRKTADSSRAFPPAPDLLDRQFASAAAPNQAWLADLAGIATGEGWLHVAVILDPAANPSGFGESSRKPDAERRSEIVGWATSEAMPQELALAAPNMAAASRNPGPGLLRHSDRGGPYAANACRRVLDAHRMRRSTSRTGNRWDNAPMEGFFGSLKTELDGDGPFETRQAARTALFGFIEGFRNRQRLHSALGHTTPANKEQIAAAA